MNFNDSGDEGEFYKGDTIEYEELSQSNKFVPKNNSHPKTRPPRRKNTDTKSNNSHSHPQNLRLQRANPEASHSRPLTLGHQHAPWDTPSRLLIAQAWENQHIPIGHPGHSHNGLNTLSHQAVSVGYSNDTSLHHNLRPQLVPWESSEQANDDPTLRTNNFGHQDASMDYDNISTSRTPSRQEIYKALPTRSRREFSRSRGYHGLPNPRDTQPGAPYPQPPRSPSLACSTTNPVRPMTSWPDTSAGDLVSPLPPRSIQEYYDMPLGYLPPHHVCIAAGKKCLARVPITIAANVETLTAVHRHFFSKANVDDHRKVEQPPAAKRFEPSDFWFCRVINCSHRESKTGSTRQRLQHVKLGHSDILMEVIEFRQCQNEPHQAAIEFWAKDSKQQTAKEKRLKPFSKKEEETISKIIAKGLAIEGHPFLILNFVKGIVSFFNPMASMPSIAAIEISLDEEYYSWLLKARRIIQKNVTFGSFTAATWTTKGGSRRFLGLTFHYLTANFTPHSAVIGFRPVEDQQTEEALKTAIGEWNALMYINAPLFGRVATILGEWKLQENVLQGTTDQEADIKNAMEFFKTSLDTGGIPAQLIISNYADSSKYSAILSKVQKSSDESAVSLRPIPYCPTRWNSKYMMTNRVMALLPAMRKSINTLKESQMTTERREKLVELENEMITEDEEGFLSGVLQLLTPTYHFTEYVRSDESPAISEVYSRVHDMIDEVLGFTTTNPALESFRNNLVQEMRRRWDPKSMPRNILIATFLDPAVVHHKFFNDTIKIDNTDVTIREHAKAQVLSALLAKKQVSLNTDETSQVDFDQDHWTREFTREIDCYEEETWMENNPAFRSKPHVFWRSRGHCFEDLTSLAQMFLSIQASSVASERIFSVAGNILKAERGNISDNNLIRLVNIRNLHAFVTECESE
ncbi:hypothetical protein BGZ46_000995 [Entomortierella lignicola]|nr:hypothetical protein BGZ46_000995 [Entomortierella lignicola]